MIFDSQPTSQITVIELKRLIADGVQENIYLDYKRDPYSQTPSGTKELIKDVCAFANAEGGYIIIDIEEDGNRTPVKFVGVDNPVFLNIIGYQPLEPGQNNNGEIREKRVLGDLRRWQAYQGSSDLAVIRMCPGSTPEAPYRIPKVFYDGISRLDFWIIRDIYFGDPMSLSKRIWQGNARNIRFRTGVVI